MFYMFHLKWIENVQLSKCGEHQLIISAHVGDLVRFV